MVHPNSKYKHVKNNEQRTSKKRAPGLSRLHPTYPFLATSDSQCCDNKHILETNNGIHNYIMIPQYIGNAIVCEMSCVFMLWLLYHLTK